MSLERCSSVAHREFVVENRCGNISYLKVLLAIVVVENRGGRPIFHRDNVLHSDSAFKSKVRSERASRRYGRGGD